MNSPLSPPLIVKLMRYGIFVAYCFILYGCEKNVGNNHPIPVTSATIIEGLNVVNPAFFVDLHTSDKAFIAGSDGTIIVSSTNPAPNQNQHWQAVTTQTGQNILALASDQTAKNLIAVGTEGLILRSSDEGKNWQRKTSGTNKKLNTIIFDSEHKTWLTGGEQGVMLISNQPDANTWRSINTGYQSSIRAIHYLPDQQQLAAIGENGLLLLSNDGGNQWQKMELPTTAELTDFISVSPSLTLIACADGSFLRSENIATQWERVTTHSSAYITRLFYDPEQNTLIALSAEGEILLSDDGGKLWAPVTHTHQYLTDIIQLSNKTLLASGANGTLLQSDNGGRTWSNLPSLTSTSIDGIMAITDTSIVAYGEGGLLLQSNDTGNSWTLLKEPITDFVHQLLQISSDNWLAAGAKGLLINSTNQGQDWKNIISVQQQNDYFLSMISDKKSGALLAAGPPGTILRSTDQGKIWRVRLALSNANQGYFHQLITNNQGSIIALAGPGTIHYSTDSGENWSISNSDNSKHLFAGIYDDARQQFIAVGQTGAIQISRDGKNWQVIDGGIAQNLQTIYADKKTLWIGGEEGLLLRSDDAGLHWSRIATETTNTIIAITQLRNGVLLATGNNGLILRSSDSGENWHAMSSSISDMLRKPVQDPATGIIYIASRSGTIIYSRDEGQQWAAMQPFTQASIKTLVIDTTSNMLLGGGERLIRIPLLPTM